MRNLEAKFRLPDLSGARARAEALGYAVRGVLDQRDTFFRVARGKLKLREEASGAWLIHYRREGRHSLMLSNYEIVPAADGANTRAMLADALGVIAEVRKQRTLLTRSNVRLHLDRVEGLGSFGEIEAVIAGGGDPDASRIAVDELLAALGIGRADLIDVSYFELMQSR
ncbi:MAG TPA: class IV adenylate cyclase [Candidatus Binataceae bacterium]|nr:class IV adenylate cyclase [Candidatus Binataceae bacterium]